MKLGNIYTKSKVIRLTEKRFECCGLCSHFSVGKWNSSKGLFDQVFKEEWIKQKKPNGKLQK